MSLWDDDLGQVLHETRSGSVSMSTTECHRFHPQIARHMWMIGAKEWRRMEAHRVNRRLFYTGIHGELKEDGCQFCGRKAA